MHRRSWGGGGGGGASVGASPGGRIQGAAKLIFPIKKKRLLSAYFKLLSQMKGKPLNNDD